MNNIPNNQQFLRPLLYCCSKCAETIEAFQTRASCVLPPCPLFTVNIFPQ